MAEVALWLRLRPTLTLGQLVGKFPNRSLWGVLTPAGDLLHCAFPGPFLYTLHTDPSAPA